MGLKKVENVPTNSEMQKQCILKVSNEQLMSGCRVVGDLRSGVTFDSLDLATLKSHRMQTMTTIMVGSGCGRDCAVYHAQRRVSQGAKEHRNKDPKPVLKSRDNLTSVYRARVMEQAP